MYFKYYLNDQNYFKLVEKLLLCKLDNEWAKWVTESFNRLNFHFDQLVLLKSDVTHPTVTQKSIPISKMSILSSKMISRHPVFKIPNYLLKISVTQHHWQQKPVPIISNFFLSFFFFLNSINERSLICYTNWN